MASTTPRQTPAPPEQTAGTGHFSRTPPTPSHFYGAAPASLSCPPEPLLRASPLVASTKMRVVSLLLAVLAGAVATAQCDCVQDALNRAFAVVHGIVGDVDTYVLLGLIAAAAVVYAVVSSLTAVSALEACSAPVREPRGHVALPFLLQPSIPTVKVNFTPGSSAWLCSRKLKWVVARCSSNLRPPQRHQARRLWILSSPSRMRLALASSSAGIRPQAGTWARLP